MAVVAYALAFLAAGMSGLFFFRVRSPTSIVLWIPKGLTGSAAIFVAVMGALGVAFGLLFRAPWRLLEVCWERCSRCGTC